MQELPRGRRGRLLLYSTASAVIPLPARVRVLELVELIEEDLERPPAVIAVDAGDGVPEISSTHGWVPAALWPDRT
jgi:hypothetical protein